MLIGRLRGNLLPGRYQRVRQPALPEQWGVHRQDQQLWVPVPHRWAYAGFDPTHTHPIPSHPQPPPQGQGQRGAVNPHLQASLGRQRLDGRGKIHKRAFLEVISARVHIEMQLATLACNCFGVWKGKYPLELTRGCYEKYLETATVCLPKGEILSVHMMWTLYWLNMYDVNQRNHWCQTIHIVVI